jgi:hypothetical protein
MLPRLIAGSGRHNGKKYFKLVENRQSANEERR